MATVRERNLTFRPSLSPDVVAYRLHYMPGASSPGENAPSQPVTNITPGTDGLIRVPLNATLGALPEGRYSFAVASVDDAGNTSDLYAPAVWTNVELDVEVPLPPTEGGIEDA